MNNGLHEIKNWSELAQTAEWSATTLAKKCGVSLRTLERYFTEKFSKTVKCFLNEERMKKGKELQEEGLKIREIAQFLGYRHAQHFSRAYKNYYGDCPTQLIKAAWPAISETRTMQIIPIMQTADTTAAAIRI